MPNTHPSKLSLRLVISFLVLSVCAAGLTTAVAAPAAATAHAAIAQPSEWQINESEWDITDNPALLPDRNSWWGGKLTDDRNQYGQPYGHGPARHNGSSYAWVSEETGNPSDHWARWDMGTREGTQDLAVFIPRADASARVRYRVIIGSRITYTNRITQQEIYGWHYLGTVAANGSRVRIEVHYNDSEPAPGLAGPSARRVGVDAMAMRCVSDCQPDSEVSADLIPGKPRSLRTAVHDFRRLQVTWQPPSSNASSVDRYEVKVSRPPIRDHPHHSDRPSWNPDPWYVSGTSARTGSLLRDVTYEIKVTALNEDKVRGPSRTIHVKIPAGSVYIDDNPEREGRSSVNCATGGTKSCWKHYRHSVNTYFKRPNDKEFIIERRFSANDFWGTNGFHVVYADPQKQQRAIWEFRNVLEGQYEVGVYLPDVVNRDRWQPGAIVTYRVEVNDRRVLTTEIDQSSYHNRGGRWVSLGEVETAPSSKVEIFVSSYWPRDSSRNSEAASPSGTADWTYHIAADAARLMPADGVVDWSSLGSSLDDAVAWCQVDAFITLFIEPLYNVLKGIVGDRLLDAAIVVAGAAVTAATGGAAAPVAAVAVATRIGLSVKTALTISRVVQSLRSAYRFLEKAKVVAHYVGGLDTLHTLISNIGNIVTDPTGETALSTDLDTLCNIEKVWENYYGEQSLWDKLKTRIVEFFGKVIEWVT